MKSVGEAENAQQSFSTALSIFQNLLQGKVEGKPDDYFEIARLLCLTNKKAEAIEQLNHCEKLGHPRWDSARDDADFTCIQQELDEKLAKLKKE